MLYDSYNTSIKTTEPLDKDAGFVPLFAFLTFAIVVELVWIVQVEKVWHHLTSPLNCFGRRLRARLDNRQWNDRVRQYCTEIGLEAFSAADASYTAFVGTVIDLNDMNGGVDGNGRT